MTDKIIDLETGMHSDEVISKQYKTNQKDYELQDHERNSIQEIERMIKENLYKDEATIRQHLEYLEQIETKLNGVIENEKQAGLTNISLQQDYIKISRLCKRLVELMATFT